MKNSTVGRVRNALSGQWSVCFVLHSSVLLLITLLLVTPTTTAVAQAPLPYKVRFGSAYSIGASPSNGPLFQKGTLETPASPVPVSSTTTAPASTVHRQRRGPQSPLYQTSESSTYHFPYVFEPKSEVFRKAAVSEPDLNQVAASENVHKMLSPYEVVTPVVNNPYRESTSGQTKPFYSPVNSFTSRSTRSHLRSKYGAKSYYKINNNHTIQNIVIPLPAHRLNDHSLATGVIVISQDHGFPPFHPPLPPPSPHQQQHHHHHYPQPLPGAVNYGLGRHYHYEVLSPEQPTADVSANSTLAGEDRSEEVPEDEPPYTVGNVYESELSELSKRGLNEPSEKVASRKPVRPQSLVITMNDIDNDDGGENSTQPASLEHINMRARIRMSRPNIVNITLVKNTKLESSNQTSMMIPVNKFNLIHEDSAESSDESAATDAILAERESISTKLKQSAKRRKAKAAARAAGKKQNPIGEPIENFVLKRMATTPKSVEENSTTTVVPEVATTTATPTTTITTVATTAASTAATMLNTLVKELNIAIENRMRELKNFNLFDTTTTTAPEVQTTTTENPLLSDMEKETTPEAILLITTTTNNPVTTATVPPPVESEISSTMTTTTVAPCVTAGSATTSGPEEVITTESEENSKRKREDSDEEGDDLDTEEEGADSASEEVNDDGEAEVSSSGGDVSITTTTTAATGSHTTEQSNSITTTTEVSSRVDSNQPITFDPMPTTTVTSGEETTTGWNEEEGKLDWDLEDETEVTTTTEKPIATTTTVAPTTTTTTTTTTTPAPATTRPARVKKAKSPTSGTQAVNRKKKEARKKRNRQRSEEARKKSSPPLKSAPVVRSVNLLELKSITNQSKPILPELIKRTIRVSVEHSIPSDPNTINLKTSTVVKHGNGEIRKRSEESPLTNGQRFVEPQKRPPGTPKIPNNFGFPNTIRERSIDSNAVVPGELGKAGPGEERRRPDSFLIDDDEYELEEEHLEEEAGEANVPGVPGVDYPVLAFIPETNFDCGKQQYPGFYSDMEVGCQVYHSCSISNVIHRSAHNIALNTQLTLDARGTVRLQTNWQQKQNPKLSAQRKSGPLIGSKHSFLCPNGTIFSQEYLICDWWYNVKCDESPQFYPLNRDVFASGQHSTLVGSGDVRQFDSKPLATTTTTTTTGLDSSSSTLYHNRIKAPVQPLQPSKTANRF